MFLTKQGKLIKKCPACKQNFIKDKGSACLATCPAKKLEEKHKKILTKLVAYCLPKEKIIIECPTNLSASIAKSKG
jgi:Fe-S-cluster-containing dehydrogenase component